MVVPLIGLGLALVGALAVHWMTASVERTQTRDLFSRFVPDSVVAQVLERADSEDDVRLGGELLTATVLFSDLRGFTSFAEGREPAEVIGVLNRYLTEMSDAILDHDGTLVAYMGDGIMAVFGAPIASDDHADKALGGGARDARASSSASTTGCATRGSATASRWASASTPATSCRATSDRRGGSNTRRSAIRRTPPRVWRA